MSVIVHFVWSADEHLLPVSYSDVAAILKGNLLGVHEITGVAVSPPTLRIESSNTSAIIKS